MRKMRPKIGVNMVKMHPKIIKAIRETTLQHTSPDFCDVCNYYNSDHIYERVPFSRLLSLIKKYGDVCAKHRREAGVMW
jgi:hypothetical protein